MKIIHVIERIEKAAGTTTFCVRAHDVSLEMAKTKGTDAFIAGVNQLLEITR